MRNLIEEQPLNCVGYYTRQGKASLSTWRSGRQPVRLVVVGIDDPFVLNRLPWPDGVTVYYCESEGYAAGLKEAKSMGGLLTFAYPRGTA